MLRRGKFLVIGTGCVAALGAMLLIPGNERVAVADGSVAVDNPAVASFTSQETIAAIDALLGASQPSAAPLVDTAADRPAASAGDKNLQTASLRSAVEEVPAVEAPTTDLEGAPLIDPDLRPDRIGASAVNLRAGPSTATATISVLQPGQAVMTGESDGGWVEITLDDGTTGWVYSRYLASVAAPAPAKQSTVSESAADKAVVRGDRELEGRTARIEASLVARSRPNSGAGKLFRTTPGERVRILDVRGNWIRILTADGSSGWIERAG